MIKRCMFGWVCVLALAGVAYKVIPAEIDFLTLVGMAFWLFAGIQAPIRWLPLFLVGRLGIMTLIVRLMGVVVLLAPLVFALCWILYTMAPTFWQAVHESEDEFSKMMPDIYYIVKGE